MKQTGEQLFEDTSSHWAQQVISTAGASGVATGFDASRFGPDELITREQIALIVIKAAGLKAGTNLSDLTDGDQVSAWAQGGVAALVEQGIVQGYKDGSFKPQNPATRAEAVAIIFNSLK